MNASACGSGISCSHKPFLAPIPSTEGFGRREAREDLPYSASYQPSLSVHPALHLPHLPFNQTRQRLTFLIFRSSTDLLSLTSVQVRIPCLIWERVKRRAMLAVLPHRPHRLNGASR